MRAGHGRGYYGSAQLSREPPRRPRRGWIKYVVLAGIGTAIWFAWARDTDTSKDTGEPQPPPPPPPEELTQLARARGFSSTEAFENSVVASAREVLASGGSVELAAPLQYLEPRLRT